MAITKQTSRITFSSKSLARSYLERKRGKVPKKANYYYVEAIVDHREVPKTDATLEKTYEYRIRWEYYGEEEDSWIEEKGLHGSYELLTVYKKLKNLGDPMVKKKVGFCSFNRSDYNEDAWVCLDEVVERLNKLRKMFDYSPSLPLDILSDTLNPDGPDRFVCLPQENHCYMGIYIKELNTCFIGDGMEHVFTPSGRKDVKEFLEDVRMDPIRYPYKRGIDHCGASACSLGLELARIYTTQHSKSLTN